MKSYQKTLRWRRLAPVRALFVPLFTLFVAIGCSSVSQTSYSRNAGLRFPARPGSAKVLLVPPEVRDEASWFSSVKKRSPREFLPLGTLFCTGSNCGAGWLALVAKHGGHVLHRRCGIATKSGWESPALVGGRLAPARMSSLELKPGQYGCTGTLFVDLFRVDQPEMDPEMRVLIKVLRQPIGWRDTLNWLHYKYRDRFKPSWFISRSPLVQKVAGPAQELRFLKQGMMVNRVSRLVAAVLNQKRLVVERRRAVVREKGNHWVSEVVSVSSISNRPGEQAKHLVGKPRMIPAAGLFKRAWTSRTRKPSSERVVVRYSKPISPDGIRLVETEIPILVLSVEARDSRGKWHVLWRGGRSRAPVFGGRVHLISFAPPEFKVQTIRLEVAGFSPHNRVEIAGIALHQGAGR